MSSGQQLKAKMAFLYFTDVYARFNFLQLCNSDARVDGFFQEAAKMFFKKAAFHLCMNGKDMSPAVFYQLFNDGNSVFRVKLFKAGQV